MSFEEFIANIPGLNRLDDVLVCEADFTGLRAAIMRRNGEQVTVSHQASVDGLDMQDAVAELVSQFRQKGWQGKHAVLLTPAVVQAIVELQVPPKNKLLPQQMMDAVNWELDPLLTQQQQRFLSIGQILLANGYMDTEQIDDILSQQEAASLSKNREGLYKRIGELALDYGYITQRQLDQCMARQQWFKADGDAIQSAWVAQVIDAGDANTYPWLVSGMNKGLLRQWQAAFAQQQVKLLQCYPLTSSSLAILPSLYQAKTQKATTPAHHVLLEVHDTQLSAVALQKGSVQQIVSLTVHHDQALNQLTEAYHLLAVDVPDVVTLIDSRNKTAAESQQLVEALSDVVHLPIQSMTKPSQDVNLGMQGAGAHTLIAQSRKRLAAVTAADPLPPLLQRTEMRAVLAGLLLLAVIGISELSFLVRHYLITTEQAALAPELKEVNDAIDKVQARVDEVKALKSDIKETKAQEKIKQRAVALLAEDLPKRDQTVTGLLSALEQTVSEEVVIDRIAENTILGFSFGAWSINEQAAQAFVQRLQIAVHPLGYQLRDITVNQQTGRLGLLGYAISFNATTLDDEAWTKAKLGKYLPVPVTKQ